MEKQQIDKGGSWLARNPEISGSLFSVMAENRFPLRCLIKKSRVVFPGVGGEKFAVDLVANDSISFIGTFRMKLDYAAVLRSILVEMSVKNTR